MAMPRRDQPRKRSERRDDATQLVAESEARRAATERLLQARQALTRSCLPLLEERQRLLRGETAAE